MLAFASARLALVSKEIRALLVVAAIFVGGALAYKWIFGNDAAERFRIVTVSGDVRHVDSRGGNEIATEGSRLSAGDRIVSGNGGRAVLGLGDNTRVAVDASTSVTVLGVNPEGVRIELDGGRVRATVRPGSGRVGVVASGREIVADDADFTAVRDDEGTLAVVSERGSLALLGVAGVSEIGAGDELLLPAGGSPLRAPASEALLLQVVWPAPPRTREREVELKGKTQPKAKVRVSGGAKPVTAVADAEGHFRVSITLAEGENRLAVVATNLLGRETEVQAQVVRDTTAPNVGITLEF